MITETGDSKASIHIDLNSHSPLRRIWRYVGYDEPNYTYTENGRTLLSKLATLSDGPYNIRCHFILCSGDGTPSLKWGSTDVYTEDDTGQPVYSWAIIDKILDSYVEMGLVPFVELGFTPEALTSAPDGIEYSDPRYGGWRFPPRDYGRWLELVRELAAHCAERYGTAVVNKWHWELWNEPDIFYWTGTAAEYCRLYDYTVAGLRAALPQAMVGGPATTSSAKRPESSEFLRTFLKHVTRGKNHLTGETGTRIDFISYHAKGGSFQKSPTASKETPSVDVLLANVDAGLNVIAEFPELDGIEIILSECDPDGWAAGTVNDNPNLFYRNSEYYASFLAATVCKLMDRQNEFGAQIDGMLTWAFLFEDRDYFEGFRTLSTNGLDKPVLNVFRLLAELGRMRLALTSDRDNASSMTPGDGSSTLPSITGMATLEQLGGVMVFLYSHHDDWDVKTPSQVTITLDGTLPNNRYRVYSSVISETSANSYTAWKKMGKPQSLNTMQAIDLEEASKLQIEPLGIVEPHDNRVELTVALPSHAVMLLRFIPVKTYTEVEIDE